MRYVKVLLLLLVGLTACEKVILYDDIAPEPLLVVNGLQRVGEPARLCVEKSSFYINSEKDFRVKDVKVDLYVNDVFKESLQVRDSLVTETYIVWIEGQEVEGEQLDYAFNYCEGTYLLCEGDVLRFEVRSSEFDEVAIAEVTMPLAPHVISFDTIRSEIISDEERTLYFSLVIDDPAGKDYYNLYPQDGFEGFTSSDPVFADFMDVVHVDDLFGGSDYYGRGEFNLFEDSYFDGRQYSVNMSHRIYSEMNCIDEPFTVEVTKVDGGFYQYKKTLSTYQANDDGLIGVFTEPIRVYSNVQNGVGLVGAQSSSVTMVIDFTPDF